MTLPTESADDFILKALRGAKFGPNFKSLTLPSGKALDKSEAEAMVELFTPEKKEDND